jgi:acyl-CoA thioester hydrolase
MPFVFRTKVRYAETDAMGVAHHSSYLLWMEAGRVEYLDRNGYPYAQMEREGFFLPVSEVRCRYLAPLRFNDEVEVRISVVKLKEASMTIGYEMIGPAGVIVCRAETVHPVVGRDMKVVRMPEAMKAVFRKGMEEGR